MENLVKKTKPRVRRKRKERRSVFLKQRGKLAGDTGQTRGKLKNNKINTRFKKLSEAVTDPHQ